MAPPNNKKKKPGIKGDVGDITFGSGKVTKPKPPPRGSNAFRNPFDDGKPSPPTRGLQTPIRDKGAFGGDFISRTFGKGKTKITASPANKVTSGDKKNAEAARAVAAAAIGPSQVAARVRSDKDKSGASQGRGPAKTDKSPGNVSKPYGKVGGKPKIGSVYAKTRSAYKSEQADQPRRYEPPETIRQRRESSQFDMGMTGAEVKKARKAYLDSHPAAAKAVAKGTLSMGDINMTVRRLRKKNPSAIGMKKEND